MDEKVATIHVGISASSINDKIDQLLKYSALVSLLSLSLAAVLLLFALRHWVTKPLSSLFEAIQHLGRDERGGYSKINVSAGDEIGLVSSAFNGLIDDLNASLQTISLHTEKLETLVEERTAELKSVNGQLKDDIAERKRIEGILHDSESKYRSLSQELHTLLDTIPDAIGLYAPDMKIIWANRSAANLPRSETAPLTGKICYEVFHGRSEPCEVCAVRHSFRTGEPSSELIQRPGGRLLETRAVPLKDPEGRIVSVMEIGRDVTEQRRLEARLRQAQKLEVIGTIAGGIAHDFNNILAAVIGYAELAQLDLPRDGRVSQYLDEVLKSSCRARDLVKQILSFSRQGSEAERMPADLGNVLEETIGMMRASLPATVEIRHDIRCEQPVILADSPQIRQVLVNLCTNAAHAMKEKGGVLEIRLEAVLLGSEETARHADIKAGEYVRLTVSDTGCGMDRATMEKIFDPYFTTKEVGEGSGLGLAVVQGIVKRHGGAITVGSEPGKGSIFQVYLPRIEEEGPTEIPLKGETSLPGGSERILLVDDEKAVATMEEAVLNRLGYHVTIKTDSQEALDLFTSQPDQFDLLITDYTMPRLTGGDLARAVLNVRPGMPVILCTGFNDQISEGKAREMGVSRFLMKPVSMHDLAVHIRNALDFKQDPDP